MTNKMQQRRGLKANMPTGSAGELLYATDTRELYMGTGNGNVNMGGSHWYRGTAMSGTSSTANQYSYSACPEVKLDDIYMNTSNGNIYACTTAGKGSAAKWTYQGCIKGVKGDTGSYPIVDSKLSLTSKNPAQNQAIGALASRIADFFTILAGVDRKISEGTYICTTDINKFDYLTKNIGHDNGYEKNVFCFGADNLPSGCRIGLLYDDAVDSYHPGQQESEYYCYQQFTDFITGAVYYREVAGSPYYFNVAVDWYTN